MKTALLNVALLNVTWVTFVTLNLAYGPSAITPCTPIAGVTVRIRTMTRFHGLSIVTIGAALSMTAGLAFAGDTVSADQILGR